jgi:CBS domain-containing protein
MTNYKLKDLITSVDDYASISLDATILEGILALQEAQQKVFKDDPTRHRDRAVLVKNEQGEVIGKLSMWSILGCLEPSYRQEKGGSASSKAASRVGSAREVIDRMMESSHLWRNRLDSIASETTHLKIKNLLHEPREKELIDEDASLEKAIHQLVSGHFMSLLVTRKNRIIGILRLIDVFEAVSKIIK